MLDSKVGRTKSGGVLKAGVYVYSSFIRQLATCLSSFDSYDIIFRKKLIEVATYLDRYRASV